MFILSSRLYALALLIIGFVGSGPIFAQGVSGTPLWTTLQQRTNADSQPPAFKFAPVSYSLLALDETEAQAILKPEPGLEERAAADNRSGTLLPLPLPDGTLVQVRLVESSVMAPGLAQRYPQIKTYQIYSDDLRLNLGVADLTVQGFHAMFSTPQGTVFIDPRTTESGIRQYISYFKHDYYPAEKVIRSMLRRPPIRPFASMPSLLTTGALRSDAEVAARSGGQITTYRLALAATGEYTLFHGNATAALSAMATTLNRVNAIYQRDLAVRMELVSNNDLLVYTDAQTDPYTPSDASTLLSENQANLDLVIGNGQYDVGHVFSTEGGGLASLGVVCVNAFKGQGETGSSSPIGDPFDVDYVAHEMGHQFGANHTFNGTTGACGGGNRWAPTAYEPGSGSTIMAYAGICGGENLQQNSDAVFHAGSISEINTFLSVGTGATCGSRQSIGNTAPVASAGSDFTIPKQTAFLLTGSASDIDTGDSLTYSWEEVDLGTASTSTTMGDDGFRPLFRSFLPSDSASRFFPKLSSLVSGTQDIGERLPSTGRSLKFRLTVRDQAGGVADDDVTLTVVGTSGPFRLTSPNGGENINSSTTVTWDVAGTDLAPVSCSHVNIGLSTDGGLTQLSGLLASNVPNTGSASVNFPSGSSNTARLKLQCANNIFFDISDGNFQYSGSGQLTNQTITFGVVPATTIGATLGLVASASSGLPVSFTTQTPSTCTVNGSLVSGASVGTCTVTASQGGDSTFAAALPVTQSFAVNKANQTIGTISFNPSTLTVGTTTVASATATSGLPVTFTSSTASICTVSGSTVTGAAAGTCIIAANQSGSDNYAAAPQVSQNVTVSPNAPANPTRLINLSTRGQVQTGDNVMIGGFIINGASAKKVLIRAVGPTLSSAGVIGVLADPMIELHQSVNGIDNIIASNDDWGTSANAAEIAASSLAPPHAKEAAILATLPPGAYTAIVSGHAGTSGVGIVEVYELDNPDTPLINISTRGQILTGDNVMIGGFVIQGDSPQTVLITAVGPALITAGINGVLANPILELHRSSDGSVLSSNDDWKTALNAGGIIATGQAPQSDLESAILTTLQPGAYTAIVRGVGGGTGVGIIQVFAQ